MLVQTTAPRPILDVLRYPQYIYVHTLAKKGVSEGSVLFSAARDPEHGTRDSKHLEPLFDYPIEGETGFQALEYVLPFWELFREEDKKRNLKLVPFCTMGFSVVARSAFRADPRAYAERVVSFLVMMPVTGGGILRMADTFLDVLNTTFDPWAPNPRGIVHRNLEIQDSYNRAHCIGDQDAIARRRAERISSAEANLRLAEAETPTSRRLPSSRGKFLPPGK